VAILAANVVGVLAVLVVVGLVHERLAPVGPPDG
jgi:hypothetical protein